jgi:hypothetical protein
MCRARTPKAVAMLTYLVFVDWSILLSTAIGALLGVTSTLAADRTRWRREEGRHWTQTRREAYIDYLQALSSAHSNLRKIADHQPNASLSERYALMNAAVDESGIWRSRQALSLAAPHDLVDHAITASRAVDALKDLLITHPDTRSAAFFHVRQQLWDANAELREAMRQDLGIPGPPDPELVANRQRRDATQRGATPYSSQVQQPSQSTPSPRVHEPIQTSTNDPS